MSDDIETHEHRSPRQGLRCRWGLHAFGPWQREGSYVFVRYCARDGCRAHQTNHGMKFQ